MPATTSIRRALISVYDKTGIVDFARALHDEFNIKIISTGGTAKALTDAGIPVTLVEDVTGFPEMMDGRVKTLHPKIHAAILADRDNPEHMRQLKEQGIEPIDMVVVNLYPFEKTIADPDCTFEQAIEMIDIGGPCLLRAAAKNHQNVVVVPNQEACQIVLTALRKYGDVANRDTLAGDTFAEVSDYDERIQRFLNRERRFGWFDTMLAQRLHLSEACRYGENPHQWGAAYADPARHSNLNVVEAAEGRSETSGQSPLKQGGALSFNNYADASAALELCAELTRASHNLETTDRRSVTQELRPTKLGDRPPVGHSVNQTESRKPGRSISGRSASPSGGPTSGRSVTDEIHFRRHLPHIEKPESIYFITFRVLRGTLAASERTQVLSACRFWHGKKMTLHCTCVMPDHVHMILTPFDELEDRWVPLAELLKSIKSFSARDVNKSRGVRGSLWLDENFDRIIRNELDFHEKWDYIYHNPVTAGLVSEPNDYQWFWQSGLGYGELAEIQRSEGENRNLSPENDRPEVDPPSTDRPEVDPPSPDRPEVDPPSTDRPGVDPPSTDRPEVDPPSTDRPEVGPPSTDRPEVGPPACCFIKHTNACGTAVDADPIEAYRRAYLGDPNAAMGGILAVNFNVDAAFATAVMETYQRWGKPLKEAGEPFAPGVFFIEVWIAPSFDEDAVRAIRGQADEGPKKKWGERVRLLEVGDMNTEPDPNEMDLKKIAGGVLMQTRDLVGLNEDQWKVVTEREPTDAEMDDLRLAWLVCKHTKSNAITICKDGTLIGNGAGQMSRVMSCQIATWLAKENGHADKLAGSAAASDAFFPFRDGPDILADAGVTAIIQPGGSKRDGDTIAACNERGVAMIFTGTRHFKH